MEIERTEDMQHYNGPHDGLPVDIDPQSRAADIQYSVVGPTKVELEACKPGDGLSLKVSVYKLGYNYVGTVSLKEFYQDGKTMGEVIDELLGRQR